VVGGGGTGLTVEVDPVFANWIPDHTADLAKSTLQSLGTVTLGAVGGGTVGDFTPASNLRGAIKFVHGDQSNNITTTIYASSSTTGAHYYLPAALPATGQVLGQSLNDGAYDLEWVTVDVDANRSYWGRNEAGEITLKAATNRLSDVYWTTNSTGEVILQ